MAWHGYFSLAGNEVVNNERAVTYARAYGVHEVQTAAGYPGLPLALDEAGYVLPPVDEAPWYDQDYPVSERFCGVIGKSVTGLDKHPIEQTLTPRATDGSVPARRRLTHREVAFTVLLVALDEEALSYGMSWLTSALTGAPCAAGCGGDDLCFFGSPPAGLGDEQARLLLDVVLLDGPELTGVKRFTERTCGNTTAAPVIAEVTFTLAAGSPHIHHAPTEVVPQSVFAFPAPNNTCAYRWVETPGGTCNSCGPDPSLIEDPVFPDPDPAPGVPVPTEPAQCTSAFSAATIVATFAAGSSPQWLDAVPLITVRTGITPMRRLRVRFGAAPPGGCEGLFDDTCAVCGEVGIPFLPAGSVAVIDGRRETVTVEHGPSAQTYMPAVYGPGGSAPLWPILTCGQAMCVEVSADADTVSIDASAEVGFVIRSDAA
jgi:hypothetical protein